MSLATPPVVNAPPVEEVVESKTVVEVNGVTFNYGSHRALDNLTLELRAGEVTGLLGHNGAGKTTAIKLVNGLFRPKHGSVRVFGLDPTEELAVVRKRMAVVTDTLGLSERETPRRSLRYHASLYGLDEDACVEAGAQWLVRFGLDGHMDNPIKTFSRGMRQRFALCRALAGSPDVLLLDEPTLGMDPVARQDFRAVIDDFRNSGGTVLMSTHDLGEVEKTCQQVVVIEHGRIVTSGTTADFLAPVMRDLDVEIELESVNGTIVDALKALPYVRDVRNTATTLTFQAQERSSVSDAVQALVFSGARILRIGSSMPTLEDAYLTLHGSRQA